MREPENGLRLRDGLRKAFRTIPGYMSDLVTLHIQVDLHMLTSNRQTTQCLYHHGTKKGLPNDGEPAEKTKVAGIPYPRAMDKEAKIVVGYLHCGCSEKAALLELIWWKTGKITSPTSGLSDIGGPVMNPRHRAFVIAEWESRTALQVEDLFEWPESDALKKRRTEGGEDEKQTDKGKAKAKERRGTGMEVEAEDYVVHKKRTEMDILEVQISRLTARMDALRLAKEAEEAEEKKKKEAKKAGPSRYIEDV